MDNYLDKPIFVSKVSLIKYAGEDFVENSRYMSVRNKLIVGAMACLSLEVLFLILAGLWYYKP